MSDYSYDGVISQNRQYWESLAPHRRGIPIESLRSGDSVLTEGEREAVGDVRGRRVLQLACSVGDEALTFARMGAKVTAVDIAPSHLATGRAKARALGLTVDFREQDMMNLDPGLTGFDLVFISYGGVCWVPNLRVWAKMVAERLNANGLLVISEHHPLWEVLTVADHAQLAVSGDYFDPTRPGYADPLKAPRITREVGVPQLPHTSYVWNLGDVVGAVISAGLTVRSLQEFGEVDMYPGLGDDAEKIPGTYLLSASRLTRR